MKPGKYDLVLDPSNLFLTIHENVGHPLELDRVLGYGQLRRHQLRHAGQARCRLPLGSDIVTFFADKTQPGSLGAVGYDDGA